MVVANKCDALSKTAAARAVASLRKQLKQQYGHAVPVLPVSGKMEVGVEVLQEAIRELVPEHLLDEY